MKPLKALFRETWWLWTGCVLWAVALTYFIHRFFLVFFPMLAVVFVYFAIVRFDSDGNPRGR